MIEELMSTAKCHIEDNIPWWRPIIYKCSVCKGIYGYDFNTGDRSLRLFPLCKDHDIGNGEGQMITIKEIQPRVAIVIE